MERSSKRGKIPQQDWPSIIKRYEAGETLASIARTYDCSPPAISYIVSRSRARETAADGAVAAAGGSAEPGLVKGLANGAAAAELSSGEIMPEVEAAVILHPSQHSEDEAPEAAARSDSPDLRKDIAMPERNDRVERHEQTRQDANVRGNGGEPRPLTVADTPPLDSEPRRTLRLSLAHDGAQRSEAPHPDASGAQLSGAGERSTIRQSGVQQHGQLDPGGHNPAHRGPAVNGGPVDVLTQQQGAREGGAFIDQALRERVDGDIAAFLAAFDAALAHDTPESRAGLRDATDRLLRAGARTRIELERLEARLPLPPRDGSRHTPPAWRAR